MSEEQARTERPSRRYVEEITDPWTGEITRYSAPSLAELEAAVAADWEPEDA